MLPYNISHICQTEGYNLETHHEISIDTCRIGINKHFHLILIDKKQCHCCTQFHLQLLLEGQVKTLWTTNFSSCFHIKFCRKQNINVCRKQNFLFLILCDISFGSIFPFPEQKVKWDPFFSQLWAAVQTKRECGMVASCWQRLQCVGFSATEQGGDGRHRALRPKSLLQGFCVGSREQHPPPELAEGSWWGSCSEGVLCWMSKKIIRGGARQRER